MIGLTRRRWLTSTPRPPARPAPAVPARIVPERGKGAARELGRAIGVAARSAPLDEPDQPRDPLRGVTPPAVVCQVGEGVGERGQPERARSALAGALVREVPDDPGGLGEPA